MRRVATAKAALVCATFALLGVTMRSIMATNAASAAGVGDAAIPELPVVRVSSANPDSLSRLIASTDPFRVTRRASTARFDPEAGAAGPPQPPPIQRPVLTLAGVLLGAIPAALIDGLPGTSGTRVVQAGEHVGDLIVRSITAGQVVIAGRDTTWTLRIRSRYQ